MRLMCAALCVARNWVSEFSFDASFRSHFLVFWFWFSCAQPKCHISGKLHSRFWSFLKNIEKSTPEMDFLFRKKNHLRNFDDVSYPLRYRWRSYAILWNVNWHLVICRYKSHIYHPISMDFGLLERYHADSYDSLKRTHPRGKRPRQALSRDDRRNLTPKIELTVVILRPGACL